MTTTPDQLARKLNKVADRLPLTARSATEQSTKRMETVVNRAYARKIGPEQRLSGTARRGGAGARVRAKGDTVGQRNPVGRVRMLGPAQFVEYPTAPHVIGATALGSRSAIRRRVGAGGGRGTFRAVYRTEIGRSRTYRRQAKRALNIGGNLRAYARHPGTKGDPTFFPAVDDEAPNVARAFRRALRDDVRREVG